MSLFVAGAIHDCFHHPAALVTAEGRVACRPYPGLYRQSPTLHWPGAVSLRAAERPCLFVSAAALVPYDVSERKLWIFSPSVHSCDDFRWLRSGACGSLATRQPRARGHRTSGG